MTARKTMLWLPVIAAGVVIIMGCEPPASPPPEIPETPPLAKTQREEQATQPATEGMQLPPGHPPIGGERQAQAQEQAERPTLNEQGLPPGHPSLSGMGTEAAKPAEAVSQFDGISMTPPEGWRPVQPQGTPGFRPVAEFVLPHAEGDSEDAVVRITHFPAMQSVPVEANIKRWCSQFSEASGKAASEVAKTETFEPDGVKVTMVDISGTLISGDRSNWRMIAAEIQHPRGPHFVKVTGPEATVAKWASSVREYLNSAHVTE